MKVSQKRVRQAQRLLGQQQHAGGGDWDELRQPLDEAQDDGVDPVRHGVPSCGPAFRNAATMVKKAFIALSPSPLRRAAFVPCPRHVVRQDSAGSRGGMRSGAEPSDGSLSEASPRRPAARRPAGALALVIGGRAARRRDDIGAEDAAGHGAARRPATCPARSPPWTRP